MISMPRTGSTWSENIINELPGFVHFEKRHKMNRHFSQLNLPHLSFFRDPSHWYLSMYYYYQKRKSGDIYACLNAPLRVKIFMPERVAEFGKVLNFSYCPKFLQRCMDQCNHT